MNLILPYLVAEKTEDASRKKKKKEEKASPLLSPLSSLAARKWASCLKVIAPLPGEKKGLLARPLPFPPDSRGKKGKKVVDDEISHRRGKKKRSRSPTFPSVRNRERRVPRRGSRKGRGGKRKGSVVKMVFLLKITSEGKRGGEVAQTLRRMGEEKRRKKRKKKKKSRESHSRKSSEKKRGRKESDLIVLSIPRRRQERAPPHSGARYQRRKKKGKKGGSILPFPWERRKSETRERKEKGEDSVSSLPLFTDDGKDFAYERIHPLEKKGKVGRSRPLSSFPFKREGTQENVYHGGGIFCPIGGGQNYAVA